MFGASGLPSSGHCGQSEKLGMMGEGRSAFHFFLLSMLGHQPVEIKGGKLPIKLKLTKGLKYWKGTYNVIGDFMFGINHVAVHMSRYLEQMLFPFLPQPFVQLSDEKG